MITEEQKNNIMNLIKEGKSLDKIAKLYNTSYREVWDNFLSSLKIFRVKCVDKTKDNITKILTLLN
jgi:molybdenum-dependent DNA-binding transcriptional regulator ModE